MSRLTRRNPEGGISVEDLPAALEKLAAYEDAEAEGRLFQLPVKIGDNAYVIGDGKITRWMVQSIDFREFGVFMYVERGRGGSKEKTYVMLDLWGELAFSTRAEAEAALKAREAGQPHDVGEWRESGDGFFNFRYCSLCGRKESGLGAPPPLCPSCGARMAQ